MTINDQDLSFDEKYPNLNDKDKEMFLHFDESDRDAVYQLIQDYRAGNLSDDSLHLAFQEFKLSGFLGSYFLNVARKNFDLREKLRKERRFAMLTVLGISICLCIIFFMVYLFSAYPKYRTIQTVDNSVICELKPEDNPMLTDVAIQDFAKSAVLSAYSFDYVNWRTQIENATTRYFTSDGRAAFNKAIRSSGSLNYIISNTLIMKSMAISSPQIEEKGVDSKGAPYWIVRMPISTEFFTGNTKAADVQKFVAQVKVVSTKRDAFNPKGLGVYSMILKPYKEPRQ